MEGAGAPSSLLSFLLASHALGRRPQLLQPASHATQSRKGSTLSLLSAASSTTLNSDVEGSSACGLLELVPPPTGVTHAGTASATPEVAAMAASGSERTRGPALRASIMSFNVRYASAKDGENSWERRRDACAAVVAGALEAAEVWGPVAVAAGSPHPVPRPSIIGLQEAEPQQVSDAPHEAGWRC
jgi:hypothetical protein